MDWFSNNSMLMIEKSLDFVWQRQKVIAENIANVETPGYKAKYLTFEDELRRSLSSAQKSNVNRGELVRSAVDSSRARVNVSDATSTRLDGNNVVADAENVEMARAQFQYEYLIRQINDQFTRLRSVIRG